MRHPNVLAAMAAYVLARCRRDDGGCLIWTGAMNSAGLPAARCRAYGSFNARRVLWEQERGPIPRGRVVLTPVCDARCVDPQHVECVSRSVMSKRLAAEGRIGGAAFGLLMTPTARRRKHVKLDMDKARAMRRRHAETGNAAQVAREFGVSHSHAHRVCTGVWWREASPWAI
jgi:hypothetical protein